MPETPLGTEIQGTTSAPKAVGIAGKTVSLNLQKRGYFRFANREDFELTAAKPTAKLPKDLTAAEANSILSLINAGHILRGSKPKVNTRKREDRIRPYLIFLQQSRSFQQIERRVAELITAGANVQNSGYSAREVLEMMIDQELETHARNDILNMLNKAVERCPGNNTPMDEPGTHRVPGAVEGGRTAFGVQDEPGPQQAGSRSARERIARKPANADIEAL